MVICCVPNCGADSWTCDGSITFYDFPSSPDLSAKWIRQINIALNLKPKWYPRGKAVICSKHFLETDFKGDTDSLKPRCVPTVFGHKYIGQHPEVCQAKDERKTTPLIVKVNKPRDNVIENNDSLVISNVCSAANVKNNYSSKIGESSAEVMEIEDDSLHIEDGFQASSNSIDHSNSQVSSHDREVVQILCEANKGNFHILSNKSNYVNSTHSSKDNNASCSSTPDRKTYGRQPQQHKSNNLAVNNKLSDVSKGNKTKQAGSLPKKIMKKKEKGDNSDLIEIGPNTFLKINPDVIKVHKKQTPSGNTVIQFLMDQKLAKNYSSDLLPKLIQNVNSSIQPNNNSDAANVVELNDRAGKNTTSDNQENESVHHVLGHIVDTHSLGETHVELDDIDDIVMEDAIQDESNEQDKNSPKSSNEADASFIEKAPVLLTTKMPLSHCFIDKSKYILQLKQKSRQIAALKCKVSSLNKKLEELEDRCIVQERQLSYSFIKRLKSIRKNAAKGDPRATYILEQIRGYSDTSRMRWSDTTLTQCAIWCRKAPYAYEYFKKADFFKLPCLGSVKRFIKKHPEIKLQKSAAKSGPQEGEGAVQNDDDGSSSDFDFDESDGQNGSDLSEGESTEQVGKSKTNSSTKRKSSVEQNSNAKAKQCNKENTNEIEMATESIADHAPDACVQKDAAENTLADSKQGESDGTPIQIEGTNLELQEIVLPSGEVVQCYSSTVGNGADIGGQYYIIPNVGDQNTAENEYNVIQADSLPVVLQNLETSQLHLQQDQLIFIANSSDQVECSETEVTSV